MSVLLKKAREGQGGFTIVELTIVAILSLIMLAGMIALMMSSFQLFNSSKNLQAISDSARRSLSAMSRQLKTALYLDDANCSAGQITFYADIDADNTTATTQDPLDAERVSFTLTGTDITQTTTAPASEGGATTTSTLGSYVSGMTFYYFNPGVPPDWNEGAQDYSNKYTGTEYNENVGHVVIRLELEKGDVERTYTQDVFLRCLVREYSP